SSTAEELASQAGQLQQTISFFKIGEEKSFKNNSLSNRKDFIKKQLTGQNKKETAPVRAPKSGVTVDLRTGIDASDKDFDVF
ncbi:MAG TPA: hypothetical protein VHO28_04750, partial [Ignavibacteriales bacterium]|nr:hypothetical protein [Ignavibacteriales bacterium]